MGRVTLPATPVVLIREHVHPKWPRHATCLPCFSCSVLSCKPNSKATLPGTTRIPNPMKSPQKGSVLVSSIWSKAHVSKVEVHQAGVVQPSSVHLGSVWRRVGHSGAPGAPGVVSGALGHPNHPVAIGAPGQDSHLQMLISC